jgi:hypothetical protein
MAGNIMIKNRLSPMFLGRFFDYDNSYDKEGCRIILQIKGGNLSRPVDDLDGIELVENNNVEITNYLNSCSQKDREVFAEKYCKAANESQLLAFLKSNTSMLDLVMKYANGKISKEKVFGAVYKGNKGEIRNLLNTLGIKGADVLKLATTYKEYAPDIALAVENSVLARSIITDPAAWGYQMGRNETGKLQQLASQTATKTDTQPETAMTLRPSIDEIEGLDIFRNRKGYLSA